MGISNSDNLCCDDLWVDRRCYLPLLLEAAKRVRRARSDSDADEQLIFGATPELVKPQKSHEQSLDV